ncbi:5'-nucleotidase C-terminal domain-containing protein [Salinicoccus sp. ID82-1]|uniref:Bifunctional 2',3'-cyclic-nucleotide 2'-phosphodiesterase/3'-nucleotidase n=1 Tax=Salinicoccus cyprini TaxID=2493691 RepID=A0A558ATR7_9STAP|nr:MULTISPECIES: 5'-nucleotidase C-terminal domain-containing protein [Salinicoccus]MCG1010866.1 5'-nucleotidase C-terminal domain-containing protein [Salinicoccus sp. ID82-1]TVT27657.1 hypothetical protein FO441_08080 [Salinicoccus cyprini]
MKLTIFATTDVHGAIYPYDYFNTSLKSSSLLHVQSYIDRYKTEHPDELVITVDNGDMLQGDVWSDYDYRHQDTPLFVPQVMNGIYDVIGIGNHEFNFGLDYLHKAYSQINAAIVNSNVDFKDHPIKERISPYVILEKGTAEGILKIGFLSVVPTQILKWDQTHLEGNVTVEDMRTTVERTAEEIRAEGADIIILLSHSGMSKHPDHLKSYGENQTLLMTMIKDIDGIVFGHTHEFFPDQMLEAEIDNIDLNKGAVNGKPMVQPGVSASHLGQLTFELERGEDWHITDSKAQLIEAADMPLDESLKTKYKNLHDQVSDYLSKPIGHIDEAWHTYFSRVLPSKAVQVTAEAGKAYARALMDQGEIETHPIIGFNAVIRAGRDGPDDYTVLEAGEITLSAAIDLYKHTNIMTIIKVDGRTLKEWLEWSASQFVEASSATDELLAPNRSKDGFPSYNFDVFFDLDYTVDITRPPRYSGTAKQISDSERIVEMKYKGRPVEPDDWFIVPANNYRVSYTPFLRDAEVVHESYRHVRDIVVEYMMTEPEFEHRNPMTIMPARKYKMMSATKARGYIEKDSRINYIESIDDGFSWYEIDLSKEEQYGSSKE